MRRNFNSFFYFYIINSTFNNESSLTSHQRWVTTHKNTSFILCFILIVTTRISSFGKQNWRSRSKHWFSRLGGGCFFSLFLNFNKSPHSLWDVSVHDKNSFSATTRIVLFGYDPFSVPAGGKHVKIWVFSLKKLPEVWHQFRAIVCINVADSDVIWCDIGVKYDIKCFIKGANNIKNMPI